MFLFDSTAMSERRRPNPAVGLLRFLDTYPSTFHFTSVLVIGELRQGAYAHADVAQRERLLRWIAEEIIPPFEDRILPVSAMVADHWSEICGNALRRGLALQPVDSLIAATAIVNGFIVVTRNEADFERCGVRVRNPWRETA